MKMKTKKQILKHLKNKFPKNTFKFLDYFSSCGNFWHHVFLRDDKKIICTEQIYNNIEYGCDLSVSYKNYNNLEEYMEDAENGFGYEWRNPNFNERIWRI